VQVFLHIESALAVGILVGLVAASAANAKAACRIDLSPPKERPAKEPEEQQAPSPR